MKCKNKGQIPHNHTLDKYLKPKSRVEEKETVKKRVSCIKVPPSSGLLLSTPPTNVVLRYPINPEFREYQQEIVASCVCNNTLVCLPTGLGKTHIAAVLIANFSRWFPSQKILFLAPTRPLVRQQVSALKHLRDQIPKERILEVNGQLPARKREQLYQNHQVIFATPQTIENDLKSKRLDGSRVILMIVDECHRAVGNSSYAQLIRFMNTVDIGFRVVGLSATPGSENQKIQEVLSNLNIKKIIYKDEEDPEVKKYLHQKIIHEVQIPETNIIKESLTYLDKFVTPSISLLVKFQLIQPWMVRNGLSGTSFFLIRERFSENIKNFPSNNKPLAYAALKILCFLFKCRKSLTDQGYQTFKSQFFGQIQPSDIAKTVKQEPLKISKGNHQANSIVAKLVEEDFTCTLEDIYQYYPEQSNATRKSQKSKVTSSLPSNFKKGLIESKQYKRLHEMFHQGSNNQLHPKLLKLAEILKTFFQNNSGKAMVFTQLRISAKEIKEYLQGIDIIKSQLFFGQSKTLVKQDEQTGESFYLQLKQKAQLEVIDRYKRGEINTLISTSIGEEGLDIGEVDCIICYDGGYSPIRGIQRRGRTGRKRTGEVYILLMEGKQCLDYKKGSKKMSKMKELLRKNASKFEYYPFNSSLFEQNSVIPIEYYQNELSNEQSSKKVVQGEEEEEKATKKPKRGRQMKTTNIQQIVKEEDQVDRQIKFITLASLLVKYQSNEQTTLGIEELNLPEAHQIQQQQTSFSKSQLSFHVSQQSEDVCSQSESLTLSQSLPQSPEEAFTIGSNEPLMTFELLQFSLIESIIEESEGSQDEDNEMMMEYLKGKQEAPSQPLQEELNQPLLQKSCEMNLSNSQDSMQSDEILSILEKMHEERQLLSLEESN